MKNSGIEWIGEIPDGWETVKSKYLVYTYTGNSIKDEDKSKYEDSSNALLYISTKNIDLQLSRLIKTDLLYVKCDDKTFVRANKNDTLMCIEGGSAGKKKVYLNEKVCFVNKLCCFHPYNTYSRYLYFILQSPHYEEEFNFNISGLIGGVSKSKIDNFYLIKPPIDKQKKIADYLDEKSAKIDKLIELQTTMLEKLKAYKQSVITEAVTKGLNPSAPLKDSGIIYYDMIPSKWGKGKVLNVLSMPITDGPHTTPEFYDEGIPFISAEAIKNGKIDFNLKRGNISKKFYDECSLKYVPQRGDIFMIKSGATTGNVAYVDTDIIFTIWSPLAVFRCNKGMNYKFLYYFLQSKGFQQQIQQKWSFGTQQNIGMRILESLLILLPPLSEQQEIAEYLDKKCAKIDELIALKQQKIERLKDYKKSIIYEYVTGKKEVV